MRLKIINLLAIAVCSFLFVGCDTMSSLTEQVNPSRRANLSGTITTGPMGKMPSLESRGVSKIGLVVDATNRSAITKVGFTVFQNNRYENHQFDLITPERIEALFINYVQRNPNLEIINLSEFKGPLFSNLKISNWDGKGTLDVNELKNVISHHNVDVYLFVNELELSDYIGYTNQRIGPKGIYHRAGKTHVFGGFEVRLIDARTGKQLKHASYVQATSRPVGIGWRNQGDIFREDEVNEMQEAIDVVYNINVEESLMMLKAIER